MASRRRVSSRDAVSRIVATLRGAEAESHGRYVIEQLALLAACAALRRQAPSEIAEEFAQSQFGARGFMYGSATAPVGNAVLDRALAN